MWENCGAPKMRDSGVNQGKLCTEYSVHQTETLRSYDYSSIPKVEQIMPEQSEGQVQKLVGFIYLIYPQPSPKQYAATTIISPRM